MHRLTSVLQRVCPMCAPTGKLRFSAARSHAQEVARRAQQLAQRATQAMVWQEMLCALPPSRREPSSRDEASMRTPHAATSSPTAHGTKGRRLRRVLSLLASAVRSRKKRRGLGAADAARPKERRKPRPTTGFSSRETSVWFPDRRRSRASRVPRVSHVWP